MKKTLTRAIGILVALAVAIGMAGSFSINAYAEETEKTATPAPSFGMFTYIPISADMNLNINPYVKAGRSYFFLPSSSSLSSVYFHYETTDKTVTMVKGEKEAPLPSDTAVNISKYLSADVGDGSQMLTIHVTDAAGNVSSFDYYIMKSASIASMYIFSGDPAKDRTYVEEKKANKAAGSMIMLDAKGNLIYSGGMDQIKARGNTTFGAHKKPYQIKLAQKTDLTQTGSSANASKTWILLANAFDPTLIHNTVAYKMAQSMGINSPDCRPVDLYYDGNYRGNYLVTEKVEFGDGRVNVSNLASKNEKANDGKNLDANATAQATNKYGDTYQYVTGMNNPEDITGGYLLEHDNQYYKSERCYFVTSIGVPFVVKSPENCSKEEMEYISCYVEEMIQAAAAGGVNPTNEKSVWDYVDKQSMVKYFVLQEIVKNADAYASSTYFYKDKGSNLVAGPVWDFDDSYGIREDRASTDAFASGNGYIGLFMELPEFRTAVKSFYNQTGYSKAVNAGIDKYSKEISASQKMNRVMWKGADTCYQELESYEADLAYMKNFASERAKWLKGVWATW